MSDIIFYTNNEETYRISFPTLGTKCPETKLEIKMTEPDISKVLIEGDYATIMGVKYKRVEEPKSFYDKLWEELGKKVGYGIDCDQLTDRIMDLIRNNIPEPMEEFQPTPQTPEQVAEGLRDAMRQAKKDGVFDNVVDEPDWYDEVEHDEKDNPPYRITDEVVNKLLKKWEENPPDFLKFEMGKTLEELITRWWLDTHTDHKDWDVPTCVDDLIDQIQLWLPKEQSHEGTQDVSVIDLVDGYNDCLTKIKSKLRSKR
jgi:hypothetical protein